MAAAPDARGKVLEEPAGMEDEAQLLRELAEVPAITAAWITEPPRSAPTAGAGHSITVQYAQRDLGANRLRKSLRTIPLPRPEGLFQDGSTPQQAATLDVTPSFPAELPQDVLLHSVSPSGRRQLLARKASDGVALELWAGGRLTLERCVPRELHGGVYADNWFGAGAAWSSDETRVCYVAEAPQAVKTPDWGAAESSKPGGEGGPRAAPKSWRGYGEFQEDWGERNTGKRAPTLFVLETGSGAVAPVAGLPADCSVGQPAWEPGDRGLVCVCWPHSAANFPGLRSQRLGIVYCLNRPCHLLRVRAPLPGAAPPQAPAAERLDTGLASAICPRFAPGGRSLVFISHHAAVTTGAHCASATLELLHWPPPKGGAPALRRTLIGTVARPHNQGCFPGMYSFQPGAVPFAFTGEDRLLITSHWRSYRRILEVRWGQATGGPASVEAVTPTDGPQPAWTLLAANTSLAVAVCSGPGRVPSLAIARSSRNRIYWAHLQSEEAPFSPRIQAFLAPTRPAFHVMVAKPTTPPEQLESEVILLPGVGPSRAKRTLLMPHGGPHAVFTAEWTLAGAFWALLGYNVLLVNFRGSLGFGEEGVQSLPGRVGTNDVADCISALDLAVQTGWVEGDRVAVVGGSHGGFLAGHLLGQHPARFAAGVLRNPVLDLGLMTQLSDIPDWCFVEAFGPQEGMRAATVKPSAEQLAALTAVSPIRHVNAIRAPMCFMLGAKDRRVVMRDAQQFVAALRSRPDAPETRTVVFPEDSHALELPQTEFEQWLNAAWWLRRFV